MNTRLPLSALAATSILLLTAGADQPKNPLPPNWQHVPRLVRPLAAPHAARNAERAAAFSPQVVLWQSIDVTGAVGTAAATINDVGEIAGDWADSTFLSHGFVRRPDGRIVTFDPPGMAFPAQPAPIAEPLGTTVNGINNRGDITGFFTDAGGAYHSFVRWANGRFIVFDDPESNSAPLATLAFAINDFGDVVGEYFDASGATHGFLRRSDGAFVTIDAPNGVVTSCNQINLLAEVGCQYADANAVWHGLLRKANGRTVSFDAPGAGTSFDVGTFVGYNQALNIEGMITGEYADDNDGYHGYVRHQNGRFAEFLVPGSGSDFGTGTLPASLNLLGTAVGFSYRPFFANTDGWIRFANGKIVVLDAPVTGQEGTYPYAVNDWNELTGFWYDASAHLHGFVAVALP